jgi:hypothetical protein
MIGEISGKSTWKMITLGKATKPSAPWRGRNKTSRCFQAACMVPYIQR